jgi:hypothetical protein
MRSRRIFPETEEVKQAMPCYEVNRMSVEFNAENEQILSKAIKALGFSEAKTVGGWIRVAGSEAGRFCRITIKGNTAEIQNDAQSVSMLNRLKRQYSKEIVSSIALKKGWTGAWKTTGAKQEVVLKKF